MSEFCMNGETKERRVVDRERYSVQVLYPDGLGFGEGGISVKEQIERGIITEQVPRYVSEILTEGSRVLCQVEAKDDGCGDGRAWKTIIQRVEGKIKQFKKSLLRAKVFGGGLVVAGSMWQTLRGDREDNETVGSDRACMATKLAEMQITYGAHTDNHVTDNNCGCGAIDNYEKITTNAVKYKAEIDRVLRTVYGNDYQANQGAIEQVFSSYQTITEKQGYFVDAGGKQSMEQILDTGAVVKELDGHHIEETIVMNDIPDTTIDQQYFTEAVKAKCQGDNEQPQTVQAFCVDIWRGRELAEVVAEIAYQKDPTRDKDELYRLAFADFLIRTLSTASTLTAGDLPVYYFSLK